MLSGLCPNAIIPFGLLWLQKRFSLERPKGIMAICDCPAL